MQVRQMSVQQLILVASLVLAGCDEAHFTERQPVDAKDLKTFPRAFRGKWHDEKGEMYMIIDATRVSGWDREAIYNGVHSSNPLDTVGPGKALNRPVKSLKVRFWSETLHRVDTLTNYLVRENFLYAVEKQELVAIAKFEKIGDSLVIAEMPFLQLGENIYMRRLNDTTYMVNLRYKKNDKEDIEWGLTWWCPILIELSRDKMYVSVVRNRIGKSADLIASSGGTDYFDSQWSANTILRFRDSLFEKRDMNSPFLIRSKVKSGRENGRK